MRTMDAYGVASWASCCVRELDALHTDIDRLNVYPVPDSDTGSNLLHTIKGAHAALDGLVPAGAGEALTLLARGAVAAARGNSGVIAAQSLRGFAQECAGAEVVDGRLLAAALVRAERLATEAVAHPVAGTMLSVLAAAASGAAEPATAGDALDEVALAAVAAAEEALTRTPGQLAVLAEAGVVDAGGRGVLAMLDALVEVVCGRSVPARPAFDPPVGALARPSGGSEYGGQPWEVMFHLDGVDDAGLKTLRAALDQLGDCVTIAGDDDGRHAIHVHCADIGAAVEAGLAVGKPYQVRVESLTGPVAAATDCAPGSAPAVARALVAVVTGDALAELCRQEGITVVAVDDGTPPAPDRLADIITGLSARHVTVLPGGIELTTAAEVAVELAVAAGQDVVVIPCGSPVQALAALAVHDLARRAGDDVVAMAEAAAATRRGHLSVADQDAITWVGRVNAGDLVGFVDDEVVLIESAAKLSGPIANAQDVLLDAASAVLGRMLAAGGELVTVLLGAQAPDGLGDLLADRLADGHPEVEVAAYSGGQTDSVLSFGVE